MPLSLSLQRSNNERDRRGRRRAFERRQINSTEGMLERSLFEVFHQVSAMKEVMVSVKYLMANEKP
jgi:hypothetical protein